MKILSMEIYPVILDLTKLGTSSPSPLTATFAPAKTGEDNTKKEKVMHKRYFKNLKNFILKNLINFIL